MPRLVGLVGEIEAEVSELIAHIAHPPEVLDHSNAEHARMIEALERHDVARAVRLLRRHLDGTVHILGGLFLAGPRLARPGAHQFVIDALRMWPRSSP